MYFIINSPKYGKKKVLVDKDDYENIKNIKWYVHYYKTNNLFYVQGQIKKNGIIKNIRLHRYILDAKKGEIIDHINNNPLDNRRSNLRFCKHGENMANSIKKDKTATCKYKGVYVDKTRPKKKFHAQIRVNKKLIHLGRYFTPEEAAKAYNEAAIKYHGEFANINKF